MMSFCCGASMIGAVGTLKYDQTYIHEVPILHCPICQKIEVHRSVREEYEILADYAQADYAPEVFFTDYVELKHIDDLFHDCIDVEGKSMTDLIRSQIDNALDLMSVAKKLDDQDWQGALLNRLKVLSERLRKYRRKEAKP